MTAFPVETVPIEELRAHPKNYVVHPPDELEHVKASIEAHGIYKNIVIARDSTILAGHGLVEAARQLGLSQLPVIRLDIDPLDPRALQVLTGDNEIMHLRQIDDRALADLFKEIKVSAPGGLLGTGYDDMMLSNLVFVTRPASEIASLDAAAEWAGMPEYASPEEDIQIIVRFRSEEDRIAFAQQSGLVLYKKTDKTHSAWWPPLERNQASTVRFEVESND
jgi:hypothetical protein